MPEQLPRAKSVAVTFVEPVKDGFRFRSGGWPIHITIAPPFSIDSFSEDLIRDLEALFATTDPFGVTVEGEDAFGPKQDLPVNLVSGGSLGPLHEGLIAVLERHGARFQNPNHIKGRYRPHVTHQQGRKAAEGERFAVEKVAFIDELPDDAGFREVKHSFPLGKIPHAGTSPETDQEAYNKTERQRGNQ